MSKPYQKLKLANDKVFSLFATLCRYLVLRKSTFQCILVTLCKVFNVFRCHVYSFGLWIELCSLSLCFWKVDHGFSFSFCVLDELWLCIYSKITSIQTNFGLNFQIEYGNQKKASMISNIKYLSHVHVLWQIERIFYWKTLSSEAQTILHHYE